MTTLETLTSKLKSLVGRNIYVALHRTQYYISGTLEEVGEDFLKVKDLTTVYWVPLTSVLYVREEAAK